MMKLMEAIALGLVQGGAEAAAESAYPKVTAAAAALFCLFVEPVRDHWPAFLVAALLFFATGFVAGRASCSRRRRKAEAAEKELAEKARRAEDERRRGVVMASYPWAKAMLVAAVNEGAYCRDDEAAAISINGLFPGCCFITANRIPSGRIRLEPTEELARFIAENGRLFEDLEDEIASHALYDPSKKKRSNWHSSGGRLDWWWYSDEEPPAVDFETERAVFAGHMGQI